MFLCPECHKRSTCRSEVHIDISERKCEGCGLLSTCFGCGPGVTFTRRSVRQDELIAKYRNTKQLPPYRKIRI